MRTIKFYVIGYILQLVKKGYFAKTDDGEIWFVEE